MFKRRPSGHGLVAFVFTMLCLFAAHAEAGPGGTTGGNVLSETLASPEEIRAVVQGAKPRLMMIFKSMHGYISDFSEQRGAYRKMYRDNGGNLIIGSTSDSALIASVPIFRETNAADFKVEPEKDCFDQDGQSRDAAVIDKANHQICVSLARLSKTVYLSQLYTKIYGLLAHEVSHLAGTTEPEAVLVQGSAERIFDNARTLSEPRLSKDLSTETDNSISRMDSVLKKDYGAPYLLSEKCLALGQLQGQISRTREAFGKYISATGTQYLSIAEQTMFNGILVKADMLEQYCRGETDWKRRMWNESAFKGSATADAADFAHEFSRSHVPVTGVLVGYIGLEDDSHLKTEIAEIKALFINFKSKLNALHGGE